MPHEFRRGYRLGYLRARRQFRREVSKALHYLDSELADMRAELAATDEALSRTQALTVALEAERGERVLH